MGSEGLPLAARCEGSAPPGSLTGGLVCLRRRSSLSVNASVHGTRHLMHTRVSRLEAAPPRSTCPVSGRKVTCFRTKSHIFRSHLFTPTAPSNR